MKKDKIIPATPSDQTSLERDYGGTETGDRGSDSFDPATAELAEYTAGGDPSSTPDASKGYGQGSPGTAGYGGKGGRFEPDGGKGTKTHAIRRPKRKVG